MKRVLFIIFLLLTTINNAQNPYIYSPPHESPSFPGGNGPMIDFILNHMKRSVKKLHVEGKLYLSLNVDTLGNLTKIKVLRGISSTVDSEFVRIFKMMPKWIPAVKEGKKVEMEVIKPFNYTNLKQEGKAKENQ
jgi:Gram-negative bacterial TonB protein C-terminal